MVLPKSLKQREQLCEFDIVNRDALPPEEGSRCTRCNAPTEDSAWCETCFSIEFIKSMMIISGAKTTAVDPAVTAVFTSEPLPKE